MTKHRSFKEEQKFRQWWIWMIISASLGFWVYSLIVPVLIGNTSDRPASHIILILVGLLPLLLIYLFFSIKLITTVDSEGVHYRFAPWQRKNKTIGPNDIQEYRIRKYRPLIEYGGWGVRTGNKKYGKAYNVSGNIGLQFIIKNNKKLLLGTQRAESFKRAVDKMMEAAATAEHSNQ